MRQIVWLSLGEGLIFEVTCMASMRELFPEFYLDSLEVNDLNREKSNLIVFDSNFLLDILRLPTEIAEKYLEAIEKVKEHIFVPYLVGVEFNFNKKKIKIETQEHLNIYQDKVKKVINEKVEYTYNQLLESLLEEKDINFLKNKNQKINALDEIKKGIDSYHKLVLDEKEKLSESLCTNIVQRYSTDLDLLSNRIVELIGQSVAPKLEQEFIKKVQEEGQKRYDNKIPPGFDDRDGKAGKLRRYSDLEYDKQYGDYIIWKEILHKVAVEGNNIGKKVIFVTSDGNSKEKHDIMYSVKGKKVGPDIQMVNELYELRGNYSLSESSTDGEKLNKELYIIDGFRFMQLANDLNEEQVRLYEPDKSDRSSTSTRSDLILNKPYVNFDNQRDKIRLERTTTLIKIKRLEEKLLDADSEESEILSQKIRDLELHLRTLDRKIRRLNRRAHLVEKERERTYNTAQIGLEQQSDPVVDEEMDFNHKYTSETELLSLLREYQRLSRLIVLTKKQIEFSPNDLETQELLEVLQTYELMIQPIRRKIEELKTRDDSEENLF